MRTTVAKFRTKFNFSFTLIISGWGFNGFQQGKMGAKRTNELPFGGWGVVVREGVVALDEFRKRKCAKYRCEIRTSPDQLLLQHSGYKITSHFNRSIWRNIL
jgi:hypothetical protein